MVEAAPGAGDVDVMAQSNKKAEDVPWGERTDVLEPPKMIAGKYRLGRLLGEGGMGAVYAAEHVGLGAQVAIKLLSERFVSDPKSLMRFRREARAAAAVKHRNVVSVFDTGTDEDGVPFIVMELLEGESLAALLRRQRQLSLEDAVVIACQILSGLGMAHARGVVHRDLKPANIFVSRNSQGQYAVKILDFGISKFASELRTMEVTGDGALIGTPQFMAPEQIQRKNDIDSRADLYAVGTLLYRMLSGRMPFTGGESRTLMQAVLRGAPTPIRELREEVSEELEAVVMRAMACDRDDRFATAREFSCALISLFGHLPVFSEVEVPITQSLSEPDDDDIPMPNANMSNLNRPWALVSALVIGCIAVLLTLIVQRTRPEPGNRPGEVVLGSQAASGTVVAEARNKPLRFGITRYLPKDLVLRNHTPLTVFMSTELDRKVQMTVVEDYMDLAQQLLAGDIDFAALSGYAYVRAQRASPDLHLLATPVTRAGSSYEGYILTRADSGVHSLTDLRDQVFCYVSPTSTSGYLYPRALFRREGLNPDSDFKATRFTGDHLAALRALYSGACDGAVVFANILFDASEYNMTPEAFRILASTDRIPYDAYVARAGLDPATVDALKAALLKLTPGGQQSASVFDVSHKLLGFTTVTDADYDGVRRIERYLDEEKRAGSSIAAQTARP